MRGFCVLVLAAERTSAASLPCDVFASGGTPCVAAHSTVRALYATYAGSLYEVTRASDRSSRNITALSAGGFADSATQDAFCAATDCVISMIWDQSAFGNHLAVGPGGGARPNPDKPVNASRLAVTVGGHRVYGAFFEGGMGYRIDNTTGVAQGNSSETIYMVTQGTHANAGCACCFCARQSATACAKYDSPQTTPHPLKVALSASASSPLAPPHPSHATAYTNSLLQLWKRRVQQSR